MSSSLFREEVLQARGRTWLGGISLAQPMPLWILAAFAALAATAVVLFLVLGEYTRRSRVEGHLVPDLGLATIVAPVDGVLSGSIPSEGMQVADQQALVVIAVPRATAGGGDTTEGLLARLAERRDAATQEYRAQRSLLEARAGSQAIQLANARRELAQIASGIATRREQVRLAGETLARYRDLAAERYVSAVEVQRQEQALLDQQAGLHAIERQATVVRRTILQLEEARDALPAQREAGDAAYREALALVDQERLRTEASGEVLVQSPVEGIVATRLVEPGQSVRAGQPILSVLPAGATLQAQLLVPSRAIGFVDRGDAVELRYQAFPHQKFGHHRGTVSRISRSALAPAELGALLGGAPSGEAYYRVQVDLPDQAITAYGKQEPLLPGMRLEADILGEERRLYEWLLEPLYTVTGRL